MLEISAHSAEGAIPPFIAGFLSEKECSLNIDSDTIASFGALPKPGSVSRVPLGSQVGILVGVGRGLQEPEDFRRAGGALARNLPSGEIGLNCSGFATEQVSALIEGLLLGGYRQRSAQVSDKRSSIQLISCPLSDYEIAVASETAQLVNLVRGWINTPANQMGPQDFADVAASAVAELPIQIEIWDETRLEQERCGGILGVGAGSARAPRLVKLTYGSSGPLLSLVGKGITFDTGGLSLKPPDSMVGMKYDMAGAATILGASVLIAKANLPIRLEAFLCLAENMPSGSATRPGDVLTMRNGKTVEVLNTDAEGRLVMADGLSLACEAKPDMLIDVATLTGAATIALGNRYAGLMGTPEAVRQLEAAAKQSGELFWHMPIPEEMRTLLDTEIADLANAKVGNRAGGMLLAAAFLSEFASGDTHWAHLDIASSANNSGAPWGHTPAGATGVGVRTLFATATALANRLG